MSASLTVFPPLRTESIVTIRARIDSDANAGIDPADPTFLDTTEGSVYWDMTQGLVIESERLWEFASIEVPAACFPTYSWGPWLDEWATTMGLARKDAVQATGAVYLVGDPGTLVPTGIRVAAAQTDPDIDPPVFASTSSAVLATSPGASGLTAGASGTGGILVVNTYFYMVTAVVPNPKAAQAGQPASIETVVSNEATVTTTTATSSVALAWSAVPGATGYRVYRSTVAGGETLLDSPTGTAVAYTDDGSHTPGLVSPPTNLIPVQAVLAGIAGNSPANAVTQLLSPVAGVQSVTNPVAISGGAEVEGDEQLRQRVLQVFTTPAGAGNVGDYVRWALAYPPIGYATIQPLWNGPGTVRVVVTDQQNNQVSQTVIEGLQAELDPIPGQGAGLAPIGAIVTVATPAALPIDVSATLTLEAGYSLDGAAGTIPIRSTVAGALSDYIDNLAPGDDVVYEHVKSRFFSVVGVLDVAGVTVNGSAANVAVAALQVAELGAVTLA